jgi:hypothetical protein
LSKNRLSLVAHICTLEVVAGRIVAQGQFWQNLNLQARYGGAHYNLSYSGGIGKKSLTQDGPWQKLETLSKK